MVSGDNDGSNAGGGTTTISERKAPQQQHMLNNEQQADYTCHNGYSGGSALEEGEGVGEANSSVISRADLTSGDGELSRATQIAGKREDILLVDVIVVFRGGG